MGSGGPLRKILILMADEFRHDAASFGARPIADTPRLDELSRGAAIFENAYTPAPVCVPARQCFATGKYPRRCGCVRFGDDLAPGAMTFAKWFAEHGFYTVCCGKLHHRGSDQMQGWLHRIGAEQAVRWPEKYSGRPQIGRQKWRGLDELRQAGPGISVLGLQDDLAVKGACDFVKCHFGGLTMVSKDVPLLLMLSLQQPHFPLSCDEGLFSKYSGRVPIFDWDEVPLGHVVMDTGRLTRLEGVTGEDVLRATAAYAALMEQTDVRFGMLLDALTEAGERLDDWLIIFCADHGEMLGEHGRWEKRSFYEGSVKVPLFVKGPGVSSGTFRRCVSLVDIFPTLCFLAGLPVPDGLDGRNLFSPESEDFVFSEYNGNQLMVRSGRWKYMCFESNNVPEILFDLEADPSERRNVAGEEEFHDALNFCRRLAEGYMSRATK